MTTRIHKDYNFIAATMIDGVFVMGTYDAGLYFDVETESFREQEIALERVETFISGYLENCVFIHSAEKKLIEKVSSMGLSVCTLPMKPYTMIINLMIFCKLNAIMEGRITVSSSSLISSASGGITYLHDVDEPLGPFATEDWWSASTTATSSIEPNKREKIVKLFNDSTWAAHELDWKDKSPLDISSEIHFTPDTNN